MALKPPLKPEGVCRHCGVPVAMPTPENGLWVHYIAAPPDSPHPDDYRLLNSCDPSKSGQPYGLVAER